MRIRTNSDTAAPSRRAYHHGNLREALIDIAVELIAMEGVATFSIAEAARLLGVSASAPYRHFTDRRELLTAIAIRGLGVLARDISLAVGESTDPVERLAQTARSYVQFAAQHPALFEVMYSQDVFAVANANLADAVRPVVDAFVIPAYEIEDVTAAEAATLVLGAAALAHGYAAFLRVGTFTDVPDAVNVVADDAARTTRALVIGRAALHGTPGEPDAAVAGRSLQTWVDSVLSATPKDS